MSRCARPARGGRRAAGLAELGSEPEVGCPWLTRAARAGRRVRATRGGGAAWLGQRRGDLRVLSRFDAPIMGLSGWSKGF